MQPPELRAYHLVTAVLSLIAGLASLVAIPAPAWIQSSILSSDFAQAGLLYVDFRAADGSTGRYAWRKLSDADDVVEEAFVGGIVCFVLMGAAGVFHLVTASVSIRQLLRRKTGARFILPLLALSWIAGGASVAGFAVWKAKLYPAFSTLLTRARPELAPPVFDSLSFDSTEALRQGFTTLYFGWASSLGAAAVGASLLAPLVGTLLVSFVRRAPVETGTPLKAGYLSEDASRARRVRAEV
eukprot:tig00001030_g6477.t1